MSKRERDFNSDQAGKFQRRGLSNLQKAQVASYKFNKLHPWPTHGAARIPRGTEWSRANFGQTYKTANAEQREMRKATGYTGKGKYGVRSSVGSFLKKKQFASKIYDNAMDYAGMGLYTGRGLYSSNNLVDMPSSRPSMEFSSPNDETQSLIICHKEYVGDVFGPATAAFTNTSYNINPGLSQNFPFLAQFAQNFDEYELMQMVFEFHSTIDASASNNSSGNTGTIVMATNYKADAAPFSTKEEMIQYHGGVSGRLTENLNHGVECDPSKNALSGGKFVRTALVVNSDLKTFDIGTFQLALQNIPTPFQNQQVGELWVYYKVKLSKPKLFAALGNGHSSSRYVSGGSETNIAIMGTSILSALNNVIPFSLKNSTTTVETIGGVSYTPTTKGIRVEFPASVSGVFDIILQLEGSSFPTANDGDQYKIFGNITEWTDLYGATDGASLDTPRFQMVAMAATQNIARMRISVKSATQGVPNVFWLYPFGATYTTALTVTQTYLEICEIGTQFATSNSVNHPVWLNPAGVITSV